MKVGSWVISLIDFNNSVSRGHKFTPFVPKRDCICQIRKIGTSPEDGLPILYMEEVTVNNDTWGFAPHNWREIDLPEIMIDEVFAVESEVELQVIN